MVASNIARARRPHQALLLEHTNLTIRAQEGLTRIIRTKANDIIIEMPVLAWWAWFL